MPDIDRSHTCQACGQPLGAGEPYLVYPGPCCGPWLSVYRYHPRHDPRQQGQPIRRADAAV
jgi:predicted RNA-binding Zn-ribbon protein involved in translation (DUF1610 family)